ncbi:TPA: hypothetical protein ACNBIB_004055 [Escherichia coli]|uniref:hypothetical protein n=1 Tax=Escherichia coli TaxID=562 RepID=UPI00201A89D9|nr:hypothetical protein [Escherichia coli]MDH4836024.1 hypothetical protein [Escherichia coli]MDI6940068.1 hypothetical protein [Escherichia coli]MDI7052707.1 hypothetical protein [Escherichia coli]MDI7097357.1 hypothetical protein [Escherichia coli]MDZ9365294.1 hypothetical protein [Escherichia coli]
MPDAWDNMQSIDKFVNSSDETITTRTGKQLDTLHGVNVKADNQLTQQQADFETSQEERDAVVEETRQNLIPLSKQYMTLADAQADIANIPAGSATYYRSPDDSALAIEVINNGGTLEPTGRKMPSQEYVEERTGAILNSIRIYSSQAAAQADVDAGYIEDGNFCYARTESDASIASELQNEAGVLVATGRVIPAKTAIDDAIAPYSPLLPLTKTSEFFETGVSGNEYESVTDEDITFDENKNILRCIRDGKQMFFIPIWSKEITGEKLVIAGIEIDPAGIPPAILSANLLGLSQSSHFLLSSQFDPGGEFEAVTDQDIQMDENYNIISCLREGKRIFFVPVSSKSLETNEFLLSGASELINSTMFSPGGEFEAWASYSDIQSDETENLLSFLKGGVRRFLTPVSTPEIDADVVKISGVEISKALGIKKSNKIPYAQTVSGKSQVFVFNTETSAITRVTDGTANETNPAINDAGLLTWDSDRDSTVIAGKFFQADTGDIYPLISRTVIAGWGDSFMEQPVMMNTLHSLTGLTAYNFGKSGLRSTAVAARQGGEPFYCRPDGGVIPASGSVNLLPNQPGPAASASNGAMTGIKCNLGGVEGTFNWSGTQAYFTRDASGDAVNVAENVPLFVYPYTTSTVVGSISAGVLYDQHDEAILVLTCGRNNTTLWTEVLRNIQNIVNYLKPYGKRFVICPQFTQASETRGTDGYQRIHTINAALKAAFPENYVEIDGVDLMQNFKNHYNPAYAQDVTDIANDTTPTSLRTDNLHPSQVLQSNALYIGAEVNANFIYQFMKLKGWVN